MAKVLIVHPHLQRLGGIEAYFLKLCPCLIVSYKSFSIARRPGEGGLISRILRILGDYRQYWSEVSDRDLNVVHLNPSLELKSFFRESVFLLLAKLRRKKVVVFFHGWDVDFQNKIDASNGWLFRLFYGNADAYIVLASTFAEKLRNWGVKQPIHNEVITIGDDDILQFDLETTTENRLNAPRWQLLFISRLMVSKGIATTIEALKIVQQSHENVGLLIAGDGEYAEEARALVKKLQVKHVDFLGVVSGESKNELYKSAHILCFPTQHNEGFPNTIVEAMSFGLPVITRPVGGVPDFFKHGEHGYLTESTAAEDFARLIIQVIQHPALYRKMAHANNEYARSHFLSSQAASRMEKIYESL